MNRTNYKSTIGGAFSALGSALMGVGILPQLSGNTSHTLTIIATVGFACNALGAFLGHLFSADASALKTLSQKVQDSQDAIVTGDTSIITRKPKDV